MPSGDTTVWITGATSGIGEALAATVPWDGARVINIARRAHPDLENVPADLTEPSDWGVVSDHLAAELDASRGHEGVVDEDGPLGSSRLRGRARPGCLPTPRACQRGRPAGAGGGVLAEPAARDRGRTGDDVLRSRPGALPWPGR